MYFVTLRCGPAAAEPSPCRFEHRPRLPHAPGDAAGRVGQHTEPGVHVRSRKGDKDGSTLLPDTGRERLREQLRAAEAQYRVVRCSRAREDAQFWTVCRRLVTEHLSPALLARKFGFASAVALALDRNQFGWFWAFPSQTLSVGPRAGMVRRRHISDSVIQKAVRAAAREARIHEPVSVDLLQDRAGN